MIKEQLLEFKYYLDRLSMFMKESYGINEQVEIFYRQLKQINDIYDIFFDELNIWKSSNDYQFSSIIDKIGAIFGCYRNFTIEYPLDQEPKTYEEINLDDDDFLIYIKCQIVKQNFTGTREQLIKIYTTYENGVPTEGALLDLNFVYVLYQNLDLAQLNLNSVTCNIYWSNYNDYSENLNKLFISGYLTIESMGILYRRLPRNISDLATFAEEDMSLNTSKFYFFAGYEGDYYKIGADYYIWTINNIGNNISYIWTTVSSEPAEGNFLGELSSLDDLPDANYLRGGYLG